MSCWLNIIVFPFACKFHCTNHRVSRFIGGQCLRWYFQNFPSYTHRNCRPLIILTHSQNYQGPGSGGQHEAQRRPQISIHLKVFCVHMYTEMAVAAERWLLLDVFHSEETSLYCPASVTDIPGFWNCSKVSPRTCNAKGTRKNTRRFTSVRVWVWEVSFEMFA